MNKFLIFKRLLTLALGFWLIASCTSDVDENNDLYFWVGSWTCQEIEGDFAPQTYAIEIVERVDHSTVSIKGLYNQGYLFSVIAEVSGNTITIPMQNVDGIAINGFGTMDKNYEEVNLQFTANDGSGNDNVVAVFVR